jgi:hypothetical protein
MSEVTVGPLDLTGADTSGFEPVPSGLYKAAVWEAEWRQVKNEGGKTPVGTPMLNVQFKLLEKVGQPDLDVENRRVFTSYVIPPATHDPKAAARMKGMLLSFFKNLGYDEAKLTGSKGFNPDLEDMKGKEIALLLGIKPEDTERGYSAQNVVKGTKPIDSVGTGSSAGLI